MAKPKKARVSRRGFLGAAAGAVAGAATVATHVPGVEARRGPAETSEPGAEAASAGSVPGPTPEQLARDAGNVQPPAGARAVTRPGSDLMTQVLKDLGVEYVAANPGSSSKGCRNR